MSSIQARATLNRDGEVDLFVAVSWQGEGFEPRLEISPSGQQEVATVLAASSVARFWAIWIPVSLPTCRRGAATNPRH